MNLSSRRFPAALLALVLVPVLLVVARAGDTIPFRAWFNVTNLVFPHPTIPARLEVRVAGPGEASDLGKSTCQTANQYADLTTGLVVADYTITAATGDQLAVHLEAQTISDPVSPQTKLTFSGGGRIVSGTGRLAGVTGDVTNTGWSELKNPQTGEGIGYLEIRGEVPKALATFVVTNTDDSGPGSLRQAILDANATPELETIAFNLPGIPPYLVRPLTVLPTVKQPLVIDATTQPGHTDRPVIELNGEEAEIADGVRWGLRLEAGRSIVRGLAINAFAGQIQIVGRGTNTIENCHIGTDVTGTQPGYVDNSSAFGWFGIGISGSTANRIGGPGPRFRNVISGSRFSGISISGSSSNVVEGNFIGTDASGVLPLGNGVGSSGSGIEIDQSLLPTRRSVANRIGGREPGAGNVISANGGCGVVIFDGQRNEIVGNLVGVDSTGTNALGNLLAGVCIDAGGGPTGTANVISNNVIAANMFNGVFLRYAGVRQNTVVGNFIGTDRSGTVNLGHSQYGVVVLEGAQQNVIGDTAAAAGNVIKFNALGGVLVGTGAGTVASTRNRVRGNFISANAGLGIELAPDPFSPDGVTLNDLLDRDSGPNARQNHPVLTAAEASGSRLSLRGTLSSNPDTVFDLDFYANPTCDSSGHGEGERYLGSASVTTDADGNAAFTAELSASVLAGHVITATATSTVQGNTSEFSACFAVTPGPPALVAAREAATGDFLLKWETADAGWVPEENASLAADAGWKPAVGSATANGSQHTLRIASPTGERYFRLRKP